MARVLLFGPLVDVAGWRERDIDVPALSSLKALLAWEDEALGAAIAEPGVQASVDQEITRAADVPLTPSSEVAFLPPMSGG
jgi:molybdopterin synthase sulfur carrier subunit